MLQFVSRTWRLLFRDFPAEYYLFCLDEAARVIGSPEPSTKEINNPRPPPPFFFFFFTIVARQTAGAEQECQGDSSYRPRQIAGGETVSV